jgi:hypothetical protein
MHPNITHPALQDLPLLFLNLISLIPGDILCHKLMLIPPFDFFFRIQMGSPFTKKIYYHLETYKDAMIMELLLYVFQKQKQTETRMVRLQHAMEYLKRSGNNQLYNLPEPLSHFSRHTNWVER